MPAAGGPLPGLCARCWHRLSLQLSAGNASLSVNGTLVAPPLQLKGLPVAGSGFVGLGTAAYGEPTVFDELAIEVAPPQPCTAPSAAAAAGSGPACAPPAAGDLLLTVACGGASGSDSWLWAVRGSGPLGTLSPAGFPGLCAASNASRPNPQTGAPSVELQACSASSSQQLWAAPKPAAGQLPGSSGSCLEVTKNEVGSGVLLEVWACNGGLNQQWCPSGSSSSGGAVSLASMLDGFCAGVCTTAEALQ